MEKNKQKVRQILLSMLWSLEAASRGCMSPKRMSRQQFAKKYKCQDKNGVFV